MMNIKKIEKGYLKPGNVVIFPTDTVYGLGCLINDQEAIDKIYQIKARTNRKELAILCGNLEAVKEIAVLNEKALKLANAFWPGALTMILPSSLNYFKQSNKKTVGVRIPNHQFALSLIEKNGPLKTTSVNKSGEAPLANLKTIKKEFKEVVDFIYQTNEKEILNRASTTIDLTRDEIVFLREGTLSKQVIMATLEGEK